MKITVKKKTYSIGRLDSSLKSDSDWFDSEYYMIRDLSDHITITKQSNLNIRKGSVKKSKSLNFYIVVKYDLPEGVFEIDPEDITETELKMYYL